MPTDETESTLAQLSQAAELKRLSVTPEADLTIPIPGNGCQNCGTTAPIVLVSFHQNIGCLYLRFRKHIKANLCRDCAWKYFKSFTLTTLFLGWWGLISFFFTLFILPNNVLEYWRAVRQLRKENLGLYGVKQ